MMQAHERVYLWHETKVNREGQTRQKQRPKTPLFCQTVALPTYRNCIFVNNGAAPSADNQVHKGETPASIDKIEAIKIALKEWERIFGKEKIDCEKSYQAILKDGIWYVSGSLPRGSKGGGAEAEIRKKDGQIISIKLGK